jgi:hypothetical protein
MTEPMITESTLRAFWTLVFIAVGVAFAICETRRFLIDYFYGEVMPEPDDKCRILRELPDDAVGEWHLQWKTIETLGGTYDWARIDADLELLRELGGYAMGAQ